MDSVRYIHLSFTLFDQRGIPSVLRALMEEDKAEVERKLVYVPAPKGTPLSATNGYRSVSTLPHAITDRGFHLSRVRVRVKETRFTVRCSFAKNGDIAPIGHVAAITGMCTNSLWKVQCYRNPALANSVVVPELSDIEFVLRSPKPLSRGDSPVLTLDTSFL